MVIAIKRGVKYLFDTFLEDLEPLVPAGGVELLAAAAGAGAGSGTAGSVEVAEAGAPDGGALESVASEAELLVDEVEVAAGAGAVEGIEAEAGAPVDEGLEAVDGEAELLVDEA